MKKEWLIKTLALGIVFLFIVSSFVKVINAVPEKTSSTDVSIYKLITEVAGLSKKDFIPIENILSILKETVQLCNEHGLLPEGLSVEQAQCLLIKKYLYEEQNFDSSLLIQPRYTIKNGQPLKINQLRKNKFFIDNQNENLESNMVDVIMDDSNHPPIYVYGNENFTAEHGVVGGSGTPEDPYIIADWIITYNNISNSGIIVHNTDAYFIIRNCTSSGFLSHDWFCGIKLINVTNGRIEDCKVYHNYFGIHLEKSTNIEIVNCICHDNYGYYSTGIDCLQSSYFSIDSCKCYNNADGIFLWYSSHCNIENTSCYNGYYNGISMQTDTIDYPVEYNVIKNCKLYNNYNDGILIIDLTTTKLYPGYNHIIGCEIYNNGHLPGISNAFEGITIGYISNNIVEDCDIHHNGLGVFLYSSNNIVRNCSIHDQWEPEYAAQGLQIQGNYFPFPNLIVIRNNTVEHCNIYNQEIGITIYDSLRNNIIKNNIYDNKVIGILMNSYYMILSITIAIIKENNICGNGYVKGIIYASGIYTEGLGYADARNNWWNSTLGPGRILNLRGDHIYNIFWLTFIRFRPWANEPFADAGRQT